MTTPRSWKDADGAAAVREFLRQPPPRRAAVRALIKELASPHSFDLRCAADLARRVSAREPGILQRYTSVLIDLITELSEDQWQSRGYLLLAAALNVSTPAEHHRLTLLARSLVQDKRNAVRAMALEALATLALASPSLRAEVIPLLERVRREGTCAMQSRARRMLPLLLAAEVDAQDQARTPYNQDRFQNRWEEE